MALGILGLGLMSAETRGPWLKREVLDGRTNSGRRELLNEVVEVIDSAAEMVVVSTYLIGRGAIFDALRRAKEERECRVYVVGASAEQLRINRARLSAEEWSDAEAYSDLLDELGTFAMVRSGQDVHGKAVLAVGSERAAGDRSSRSLRGLVLTSNLRDGALLRNSELLVRLDDAEAAELFEALRYAFFSAASHEFEKGRGLRPLPSSARPKPPRTSSVLIRTSGSDEIASQFANEIAESEGPLVALSHSWSIDHPVTDGLIRAAQDGRDVSVVANVEVRSSLKVLRALAHAGVKVLGRPHSHAKAVMSDRAVMVSTANFNKFADSDSTFDLGLNVAPASAEELRSTIRDWVANAPFELDPGQLDPSLPVASSNPERRIRLSSIFSSKDRHRGA